MSGARFADRFLPMPGSELSSDTWGADGVIPRYIDNGIEDRVWSYWGGNIIQAGDGTYHLLVCGWLECSEKGHMEWGNSYVFNAVGDTPHGPFKVRNLIGKGHNPEVYQLNDGRYVLFVIDGYYVADDLNGTWEYGKFEFDARDRPIIEGLSNLSFAKREDGSFLMVCRGGGIWVSRDGLSPWKQITDKRVYPPVEGRFEDPVIWRDSTQYHLIVNDWLGRVAFYLRSKNGVDWVVDAGEAYMPGIAVHEDGRVEDWFKFERMKVFQDGQGRAVQANFAVIDTLKREDKGSDHHSSKNICIPLNPGLLLEILNPGPVTPETQVVRLKIRAEAGFDPLQDLEVDTLRLGVSGEVDFGRGGKVLATEVADRDLILSFENVGKGISADEFALKLIGKSKLGKLVYGYVRLPNTYEPEALLSARRPFFCTSGQAGSWKVEVENFGLVASQPATVEVRAIVNGQERIVAVGEIEALEPYETVEVHCNLMELPQDQIHSDSALLESIPLEIRFWVEGKHVRSERFERVQP